MLREDTLEGIISGSTRNYLLFREDTLQGIISGSTGNYLLFSEDTLQGIISGSTSLETVLQNDIYGQYRLLPDPQHNEGN